MYVAPTKRCAPLRPKSRSARPPHAAQVRLRGSPWLSFCLRAKNLRYREKTPPPERPAKSGPSPRPSARITVHPIESALKLVSRDLACGTAGNCQPPWIRPLGVPRILTPRGAVSSAANRDARETSPASTNATLALAGSHAEPRPVSYAAKRDAYETPGWHHAGARRQHSMQSLPWAYEPGDRKLPRHQADRRSAPGMRRAGPTAPRSSAQERAMTNWTAAALALPFPPETARQ
jgi:hypothetical protein